MYLCYIDESGTSEIPGNTSHFILTGISVPVWHWRDSDRDIRAIKRQYDLEDAELHTAWMLRPYREQVVIPNFDALDHRQRRSEVQRARTTELLRLQRSNRRQYRQTRKNYRKTESYIHLTRDERRACVVDISRCVSGWGYARLFAECIDKTHFDPARAACAVDEQAFEQVVSRFEQYLEITRGNEAHRNYGLLIHDANEAVEKRNTELMMRFHRRGTLWTGIQNIIETPLFVDSQLTSMVQIADLCSYALRRYLENNEDELFNNIFDRADRRGGVAVGVRHFTNSGCTCEICQEHRRM